jgi:hypothetical protein
VPFIILAALWLFVAPFFILSRVGAVEERLNRRIGELMARLKALGPAPGPVPAPEPASVLASVSIPASEYTSTFPPVPTEAREEETDLEQVVEFAESAKYPEELYSKDLRGEVSRPEEPGFLLKARERDPDAFEARKSPLAAASGLRCDADAYSGLSGNGRAVFADRMDRPSAARKKRERKGRVKLKETEIENTTDTKSKKV